MIEGAALDDFCFKEMEKTRGAGLALTQFGRLRFDDSTAELTDSAFQTSSG